MLLGMLVDLGLPVDRLKRALEMLPIDGWSLDERRVERAGLAACKIDVSAPDEPHGRGWKQLRDIVDQARLDLPVKQK